MTKWVTFLLLLLALLAYGLSQMRPVPVEPTGATATPSVVAVTPDAPQPTASPARPTAPKFGPPPGPSASATPAATVAANGTKVDPFSSSMNKPPKSVAGTIKATITSNSADGPARTKFPLSTEAVYLTATPEGLNDSVEVVASYRSIMDEDAEFSEPVEGSGLPRKRVFRLTAPETGWESGPYQVVLKAKGTDSVLGLARFEVLGPKQTLPETLPKPAYLDLVPDLDAETQAQSTFSNQDQKVYLRVSAPDLPAGTNILTVWSALEVDKLTSGELIAVSSHPAPGENQDAVFTYEAPPGGFHSGSYKVDVYFDQIPSGHQVFFIKPPKPKSEKP